MKYVIEFEMNNKILYASVGSYALALKLKRGLVRARLKVNDIIIAQ